VIELLKAAASNVVQKIWGTEYWIFNNNLYCLKLLEIVPGFQSSLHFHPQKDETFLVLEGQVNLETLTKFGDSQVLTHRTMNSKDSFRLFPGRAHRFSAMGDEIAYVLEVSTAHDDKDVVRLDDSRRIYSDGSNSTGS
jgi:uncharacterized cupin superfamily protein